MHVRVGWCDKLLGLANAVHNWADLCMCCRRDVSPTVRRAQSLLHDLSDLRDETQLALEVGNDLCDETQLGLEVGNDLSDLNEETRLVFATSAAQLIPCNSHILYDKESWSCDMCAIPCYHILPFPVCASAVLDAALCVSNSSPTGGAAVQPPCSSQHVLPVYLSSCHAPSSRAYVINHGNDPTTAPTS